MRGHPSATHNSPTADARIEYYAKKLAVDPKLYPVHVQLGAAYFDKAKETHDPALLRKADESFRKSIDIQPNLPAYAALSALCNYRHRFEEAVSWGRKVLETETHDSVVIAGMVEAHLGLGRSDDAAELLAGRSDGTGDFHLAAAHGVLLKAQGKSEEAAEAFTRAAEAARSRKVNDPAAWGLVQIAGVWIDSGQVDRAVPFLAEAAKLDPDHIELKIHQAEVLEARAQVRDALGVYEALLARAEDPFVRAKAFELARKLGDAERAGQHFDVAERIFKQAVEASEFYTLGALARLYLAANTRLDEALQLARRNAEHQKDSNSRELISRIERNLAQAKP